MRHYSLLCPSISWSVHLAHFTFFYFFGVCWYLFAFLSPPNAGFLIAPAHLHATWAAVFLAFCQNKCIPRTFIEAWHDALPIVLTASIKYIPAFSSVASLMFSRHSRSFFSTVYPSPVLIGALL